MLVFDLFYYFFILYSNSTFYSSFHLPHMQASPSQTPFFQAFPFPSIQFNASNYTAKFQIDKNLSFKLNIVPIKGALLFQGKLLYHNGLELKLNQKSWKLVSQYCQLKLNNLLFIYDFSRQTVNINSKMLFSPQQRPTDKIISEHSINILRRIKFFVETLYRYNLLKFSNKFCFSQFLEEAKFKRQLCSSLRQSKQTPKIPKDRYFDKFSKNNEKEPEPLPSSNIQQCFITQCTVKDLEEIPKHLQGGPKNFHYNFRNQNNCSEMLGGGFFRIQKLLCRIQNFFINSHQSNLKTHGQNHSLTDPNFPHGKKNNFNEYDILVRKTLKDTRKQHRSNHLKISKELIMVQQIKKKEHLLNYFKNQLKKSPKPNSIVSEVSQVSTGVINSQSLMNEEPNREMSPENQNQQFKFENEIYMEFHAHTLKDFIDKPNRSLDETLSACVQVLQATVDIHQSGVIHRDLKPENILIDYETHKNNQLIKLIDFAESAIHTEAQIDPELYKREKQAFQQIFEKHNPRLYAATLPSSPPECQYQRSTRNLLGINSYKIDSWSMGMILPHIYHGKRLIYFQKPFEEDMISLIKDSAFESHLSRVNQKGFDIGETLITYMGMKNTFFNPGSRLDVIRGYKAFMILDKKTTEWQQRIRKESQKSLKHKFQYSKA